MFLRMQRRQRLQSLLARYTHPSTGRSITLAATVHAGEARYYRHLHATITRLQTAGAVVHAEGSSRALDADLAATDLTPDEHDLLHTLRTCWDLNTRRIIELGWADQRQALTDPTWHTIDPSPLDLIRRGGAETIRRRTTAMTDQLDWADDDHAAAARFRLQATLSLRIAASTNRDVQGGLAATADPLIVGERTAHALAAVHAADRDVVVVWGAAHMPAMAADLLEHGYQPTITRWFTVTTLPLTA